VSYTAFSIPRVEKKRKNITQKSLQRDSSSRPIEQQNPKLSDNATPLSE
jgi:hypothetical protein